jgi:hyperosmotically inducible protein
MLRFLFKVGFVGVAVAAIAYATGYWEPGISGRGRIAEVSSAAKAVAEKVDTESVRKASAEVADRIEAGADRAGEALAEARLTAKIKSKMALDDTLQGADLDVETQGTVVTVAGKVETGAQRERSLQLARETDGVSSVTDRITVAGR